MLKSKLAIPQMFTAYAEDQGYNENGLHHFQYFCEQCDQIFSVAWGKITGSKSYYERGNHFNCPHCGSLHNKNVAYIDRRERAPYKLLLVIREFNKVVTFEVFGEVVYFSDYLNLRSIPNYKEVFRFDIARQTVTWASREEKMELGNPYKLDIFKKSILRFFNSSSLANSEYRPALTNILKTLREAVHRKLEKHLGHKVSSMHVSPGDCYGAFLLPIFNIAYRLACPDAPNLPSAYRNMESLKSFWSSKMINVHPIIGNVFYMDDVMTETRRKKDFIRALLKRFNLPDKPVARRLLAADPFGIIMLNKAFTLCNNYDYAIRLYKAFLDSEGYWVHDHSETIAFLSEMKAIYGESGMIRFVANAKRLQTRDCIRLYRLLNDDNKKALRNNPIRIRDLHDWMSLKHQQQNHTNTPFNVPQHIIRRLSMQTNRLKFFLPKESMELLIAGHQLHNCVASYGHYMKDNSRWIVLVADDNGRLVACLEIKDKELVQAKMNRNKPVHVNDALNNAILSWAKDARIKINTTDVIDPDKPEEEMPACRWRGVI